MVRSFHKSSHVNGQMWEARWMVWEGESSFSRTEVYFTGLWTGYLNVLVTYGVRFASAPMEPVWCENSFCTRGGNVYDEPMANYKRAGLCRGYYFFTLVTCGFTGNAGESESGICRWIDTRVQSGPAILTDRTYPNKPTVTLYKRFIIWYKKSN